jgi:uncharacterized protein
MVYQMSMLPEQDNGMSDDLNTPLKAPGHRIAQLLTADNRSIVTYTASGLVAFGLLVLVWIVLQTDPLGGQPYAIVSLNGPAANAQRADTAPLSMRQSIGPGDSQPNQRSRIVATGGRSEIRNNGVTIIRRPGTGSTIRLGPNSDPALIEAGPEGPLPRIAADGRRPSQVYARPAGLDPVIESPDQPRIAILVSGLGISASGTLEAINSLPGQISLAFAPYGSDLQNWVAKARRNGHEVLMQIPMEPFDYPDNDPGPHTLQVDSGTEANIRRLNWLMSRFTGYVGVTNYMGARFTANTEVFSPILQEFTDRGLLYVDDHSSPRSRHDEIASQVGLQAGSADVIIDAVVDRENIDTALIRLENLALRHGLAIGYATALPISISRLTEWARQLQGKGIRLIPISAAVTPPAQS